MQCGNEKDFSDFSGDELNVGKVHSELVYLFSQHTDHTSAELICETEIGLMYLTVWDFIRNRQL